MNQSIFNQKVKALHKFKILKTNDLDKFSDIILNSDDWDLFRINPLKFSEEHKLDESSIIDIFVHSVKVGLFDFSWNLICPKCGSIEHSYNNLNSLSKKDDFYCVSCDINIDINLDDQVEVSFNLNDSIKELKLDPSEGVINYGKYFYSNNYVHSDVARKFIYNLFRGLYSILPDEKEIIILETEPNKTYRIISLQTHSQIFIHTDDLKSDVPQVIDIDLLSTGFLPDHVNLSSGTIKMHVNNLTKDKMVLSALMVDFEGFRKMYQYNPHNELPFMTGKMLLNNQSFRELFRIQALSPDLRLNLKSLTIMFTDLKGSTEMYESVGDYKAYNLVQRHFELLTDSVRKHSGAIVKTMGDAIMATFSNPNDAVLSAIDMMKRVIEMNKDENLIGLKIGINEGNALAVNADDRLDYFGQSVNVSARVQGLAQSSEIWITDQVLKGDSVIESLEDSGYYYEKNSALLKGVGKPVIVYRCKSE